MKWFFPLSACSIILVAVLGGIGKAKAQSPTSANDLNYKIVSDVPRMEVDSWLKENMHNCGADPKHGRYRFLIGFSTGGFNSNPLNAIAMRRLAFSLLNNSFTAGDQVQAAAWEMDVWNCSQPITLSANPASRQAFVNNVPYSPMAGSKGGHDIEKALYDLLTSNVSAKDAPHTAILLFTNSDESQSPSGTNIRLFGANNSLLISEIKQKGYRYPPDRVNFYQMKADGRNQIVCVIGLFPNRFSPLAGTEHEARYPTFALDTWQPETDHPTPGEKLPNPTVTKSPIPSPPPIPVGHTRGKIWKLFTIFFLIVILLAILYLMRKQLNHIFQVSREWIHEIITPKPPGHIAYTISLEKERILPPLTSDSKWRLVQDENGEVAITDTGEEKPQADGKPPVKLTEVSMLSIEKNNNKKYFLNVLASDGFHFDGIHPNNPAKFNSQNLKLEPGDKMFCNISADNTKNIFRMEFIYDKKSHPGDTGGKHAR